MDHGIASIEIKRMRGKLTVVALGQTPRGRKYIKHSVPIEARRCSSVGFKKQMAEVVEAFFLESD